MKKRTLIAKALLGAGGLLGSFGPDPGDGLPRPKTSLDSGGPAGFTVASPAFASGAPIPIEYATVAAGGRNLSVPLEWKQWPPGTTSFAVEVVDLHPMAHSWVHWLVVDIPVSSSGLPAGASGRSMPSGARELTNGFGTIGWGGPQPPKGSGPHVYRFTVFALGVASVPPPADASLDVFRSAVQPHALSSASVTGTFER